MFLIMKYFVPIDLNKNVLKISGWSEPCSPHHNRVHRRGGLQGHERHLLTVRKRPQVLPITPSNNLLTNIKSLHNA